MNLQIEHSFTTITKNQTFSVNNSVNVTFFNKGNEPVEIHSRGGFICLEKNDQFTIGIDCCDYSLCQDFKVLFPKKPGLLLISELSKTGYTNG